MNIIQRSLPIRLNVLVATFACLHCLVLLMLGSRAAAQNEGKFRFTVHLTSVKYFPALGDFDSLDFKLVGHEIAERITALFQDKPGVRTVIVEKFLEQPEGVLVTVHFTTSEFVDQTETETRIKAALRHGYLGRFPTHTLGFTIQPIDEPAMKTKKWQCPQNNYWCADGGCIPLVDTCDGIVDCEDGSDEGTVCEITMVEVEAYPKLLTIQAGHRAQFFCGSADFRHRVKWYRNGTSIDDLQAAHILQKKGRLQIVRLSAADGGEYVCRSQLALPGSETAVQLVVVPRTGAGNVTYDVDEDLVVSLVNATEGAVAQITCTVEQEEGDVAVTWTKMDGLLPKGAVVTGTTLEIPSLRMDDAGFYECRPASADPNDDPHNVAQIIVRPVQRVKADLIARVKHIPKVTPANLTVTEGEPFSFLCTATKNAAVEWNRFRERLPASLSNVAGNLSSPSAEISHAGKYYCRHRKGSLSERIYVTLSVLGRKYPVITPGNLTVTAEEPFTFHCAPTREGVDLEWSRLGSPLPGNALAAGGLFTSSSAGSNDTGEYYCGHVGRNGEKTAIHLTVLPLKYPAIEITGQTPGRDGVVQFEGEPFNLTVTEGEPFDVKCIATREDVTVEWKRNELPLPDTVNVELGRLSSLSASLNDTGKYDCQHIGRKGESSTVYLTVLEKKYPAVQALKFTPGKQEFSVLDEEISTFSVIEPDGKAPHGFNVTVTEHEPFGYQCTTTRDSTDVVWSRQGRPLPAGVGTEAGKLTSLSASLLHTGQYYCDHVGRKDERTAIYLTVLNRRYPAVQSLNYGLTEQTGPGDKDVFSKLAATENEAGRSFNVSVTEREPFGYQCTSTRDGIQVEWTRKDGALGRNVKNADGKLTSVAATFLDDGVYFCDHVGRIDERTTIYLTVPERQFPTVRPLSPEDGAQLVAAEKSDEIVPSGPGGKEATVPAFNVVVNEGDPFGYQCTGTRDGSQVEWGRKNSGMSNDVKIADGILTSPSATVSDAGEYYCGHVGRIDEKTMVYLTVLERKFPVVQKMSAKTGTDGVAAENNGVGIPNRPAGDGPELSDEIGPNRPGRTGSLAPSFNVTVNEGEPFGYRCVATRDETTTNWARTDGPMSSGVSSVDGVLSSRSARLQDDGEYSCAHVGPKDERTLIYLTVLEKSGSPYPSIRPARNNVGSLEISPEMNTDFTRKSPAKPDTADTAPSYHVTVVRGNSFSFECTTGREGLDVEWGRKDGPLPAGGVSAGGTLTCPSASVADEGEYYCGHSGRDGERSSLFVTVASRKYEIRFFNVTVGEAFSLKCTATRDEALVEWIRLGLPMPESFLNSGGSLTSYSASLTDSGEYICGHVGRDHEWTIIQLTVLPKKFPIVQSIDSTEAEREDLSVKPLAVNQGLPSYNLTVTEGKAFSYQCIATREDTNVEWKREGKPLSKRMSVADGILTCSAVQLEDAGEYYCSHIGREGERVSTFLTVLPGLDKNAIVVRKKSYHVAGPSSVALTVTEGEPFAFECTATYPGLAVKWTRDGRELPPTVKDENGTLTGDSANLNDTGEYHCRHVGRKSERATAYLEVLPALSVSVNLTVTEGEPFSFECRSTKPGVAVEWSRGDLKLIPSSVTYADGNLISQSSKPSDTGVYYCRHAGGSVYERVSAFLTVLPAKYSTFIDSVGN